MPSLVLDSSLMPAMFLIRDASLILPITQDSFMQFPQAIFVVFVKSLIFLLALCLFYRTNID